MCKFPYKYMKNSQDDFRIKFEVVNSRFTLGYQQKQLNLLKLEVMDFNNIRESLQESLYRYYSMRHKSSKARKRLGLECFECRYFVKSILTTLRAIEDIRNEIRHIQF